MRVFLLGSVKATNCLPTLRAIEVAAVCFDTDMLLGIEKVRLGFV